MKIVLIVLFVVFSVDVAYSAESRMLRNLN